MPRTKRNAPLAPPEPAFRSGLVAIIGRANVGKSTLLNALLGRKLAIVSPKPHTTRHRLLGVLHGPRFQAGLLDTPGYLQKGRDHLDAAMSRELSTALAEADLVLLVAEPRPPGDVERQFIAQLRNAKRPALLVINKIDAIAKAKLLPVIESYAGAYSFLEIVPVSGLTGDGVDRLADLIPRHLPLQEALFPEEMLTDRPPDFRIAEIVREKVFHMYGKEIPYFVAVEVDDRERRDEGQPDYIRVVVTVDKPSQKQLLIGRGGQALKEIGVLARPEIEAIEGKPVFLELWVKVNPNWRKKAGFVDRVR